MSPSTTARSGFFSWWPRFRPRFVVPLDVPGDVVIDGLGRALARDDDRRVRGSVHGPHVELRLLDEEQRFFTPVLCMAMRHDDDGRAFLRARFAPHPHLWTLVIALYFLLALVATGGLMLAMSQLILGGPLWSLLALPGAAVAGGLVHGAVLVGQGLAADQMRALRQFVDDVVAEETKKLSREG